MPHDDIPDLERLVDDLLRESRPPEAPPTLLPRVLDAVRLRESRPWYRRRWSVWPRPAQVASVLATALVCAGLVVGVPQILALVSTEAGEPLAGAVRWLGGTGRTLSALAIAGRALLDAVPEPLAGMLFVAMVGLITACVGVGAALGRISRGGIVQ